MLSFYLLNGSYKMEVNSDVELESENSLSASPRPARKNITLKLKSDKSPSSGRGRPRKSSKAGRKEEGDQHSEDEIPEAPIFKTMEPGEPVHRNKKLRWDHKVNLLGEKVVDPLIHCCELCFLPILIYGRMIQCKHVFCFTCAKKTEKTCVRCGDPVQRIEQSALGTVFLCTYGGSKHGSNGCRRTYLSQRDLNAHIAHRHLKHEIKDQGSLLATQKEGTSLPTAKVLPTPVVSAVAQSQQAIFDHLQSIVQQQQAVSAARATQERMYMHSQVSALPHNLPISTSHQPQMALVPQSQHSYASSVSMMQSMPSPSLPMSAQTSVSSSQDNYTSAIPVVGSRIKTLISVPIQDDDYAKKQQQQQQQQQSYQSHMPAAGIPNMSYPPPSLGQYPVGSMAPNIHQPPPGVPMFSSQSVNLPTSSFTSPPPGPVPQMMTSGPPRAPPPRMVGPPGAPRFFDNQPPRAPWTGPRGPAPTGPPHQRGVLRADYNYY